VVSPRAFVLFVEAAFFGLDAFSLPPMFSVFCQPFDAVGPSFCFFFFEAGVFFSGSVGRLFLAVDRPVAWRFFLAVPFFRPVFFFFFFRGGRSQGCGGASPCFFGAGVLPFSSFLVEVLSWVFFFW